MLSQQARCSRPTGSTSSRGEVRRFPQSLWTTRSCVRRRLLSDGRRGLPEQQQGLPSPALGWQPPGGASVAGSSGWRTSCRQGTPVCTAARGPVSAAADAASPPDCPRALLGCQATFRPPVGSATRSNGRCALPPLAAPQGAWRKAPAPLRSARARLPLAPNTPARGLCRCCLPLCLLFSLLPRLRTRRRGALWRQGLARHGAPAGCAWDWRVGGPLTQR
jgi:hypothetical protein